MIRNTDSDKVLISEDKRFKKGLSLFNEAEWYLAHDYFEEIWHETDEPERRTIQGILQIAVAQLHLERGNTNGALILYGEGLGRLKFAGTPELGIDIKRLCNIVEIRMKKLQKGLELKECELPFLFLLKSEKLQ